MTTENKANGASDSVLTIRYRAPPNRQWDANRYFYVTIPKNPIHYIEYGQSPTPSIDEDKFNVTAFLIEYDTNGDVKSRTNVLSTSGFDWKILVTDPDTLVVTEVFLQTVPIFGID